MRKMLAALAAGLALAATPQPAHADPVAETYCFLTVAVDPPGEGGGTVVVVCFICYYPPGSIVPPLPQEICPPI